MKTDIIAVNIDNNSIMYEFVYCHLVSQLTILLTLVTTFV